MRVLWLTLGWGEGDWDRRFKMHSPSNRVGFVYTPMVPAPASPFMFLSWVDTAPTQFTPPQNALGLGEPRACYTEHPSRLASHTAQPPPNPALMTSWNADFTAVGSELGHRAHEVWETHHMATVITEMIHNNRKGHSDCSKKTELKKL